MRLFLLTASSLLLTCNALACSFLSKDAVSPVRELVSRADAIVLAEVTARSGPEDDIATFTFAVREILLGRPIDTIELTGGDTAHDVNQHADFDSHLDPEFWAFPDGNSFSNSMCEIYGYFEVGETYLLVLSKKPHLKAFEVIRSADDLWLRVVRVVLEGTPE